MVQTGGKNPVLIAKGIVFSIKRPLLFSGLETAITFWIFNPLLSDKKTQPIKRVNLPIGARTITTWQRFQWFPTLSKTKDLGCR